MHKLHCLGPLSDADKQNQRKLRTALGLAKSREPIITGHKKSDCDMHAAAYVLSKLIERSGGDARVAVESVLPDAYAFIERMGMQLESWDHIPDRGQMIIVVDTNQHARVHPSIKSRDVTLLIDHHRPSADPIRAHLEINDSDAVATCAILARAIHLEDMTLDMAFALVVGIASDVVEQPGRLPLARPMINSLLDICGAAESEVFTLGHPPHPEYEELLRAEAEGAAKGRKYGFHFAVGLTRLEPAFLANHLRDRGNSIAVALKPQDGGETQVSIRVDELARRNRLYANDIAREASIALDLPPHLEGGGHSDMAGALLPVDPSIVQGRFVRIIRKAIREAGRSRAGESI